MLYGVMMKMTEPRHLKAHDFDRFIWNPIKLFCRRLVNLATGNRLERWEDKRRLDHMEGILSELKAIDDMLYISSLDSTPELKQQITQAESNLRRERARQQIRWKED